MRHFVNYMPSSYAKMLAWAENYKIKIREYGVQIGLKPEEIDAHEAAAAKIVSVINMVENKKRELANAVAAQKLLRTNELKLIRDGVVAYKKNAGFTESIGSGLGVMGTVLLIDQTVLRPSLKTVAFPGYISVSFNKQKMYGVTVFSRLKGSLGWTELASIRQSPYIDMRPLTEAGKPEHREYMAMCYNGEIDLGQQSDIVSIVFGG